MDCRQPNIRLGASVGDERPERNGDMNCGPVKCRSALPSPRSRPRSVGDLPTLRVPYDIRPHAGYVTTLFFPTLVPAIFSFPYSLGDGDTMAMSARISTSAI
jgi:hypothetical protein